MAILGKVFIMANTQKKEVEKYLMKKILIAFFTILGFLTTIKLAIIYYDSNFNPYALPSFCTVSELIDCDGVAKTTHSQFLGIPLAYWGMFMYFFVAFLLVVDKLKKIKVLGFLEVFKHPLAYISALGFISFAISMILAGLSIFELKKICILCFFTYFLNLFIALIATDWSTCLKNQPSLYSAIGSIIQSFKLSFIDFIDALKNKNHLISFILLVMLGSGFLAYTSLSYCFTPQIKKIKSLSEFSKLETNPYKVTGNVLGDKDAPLVVHVYTDYLCPICHTSNLMDHKAAKDLAGFKIIHHDLPLDMDCNKHLLKPFHEGSCEMAKYSIAAEKQGKLWDMNSELFEKQPKNEKEILEIAKSLNLNLIQLKKDAYSKETAEKLNNDIETAVSLGLEGTPAMIINGKVYSGIHPYYELKEILIKAGARERR